AICCLRSRCPLSAVSCHNADITIHRLAPPVYLHPAMAEITPLPAELIEPRIASAFRTISRATSVFPVVVGVLVLFGWWRDITVLKQIVPGLVAMNPISAVGFICLG